jgi:hypothetical protein
MSMVISTDCVGSYHSIKTVPPSEVKKFCLVSTIWANTTNYMIQFPPSSNYLIQIYHHLKLFSDSIIHHWKQFTDLIYPPSEAILWPLEPIFSDSIYPPSEAILWFSLPTHQWKQFSDSSFSPSEAIRRFNLPTIGSNYLIQFTYPLLEAILWFHFSPSEAILLIPFFANGSNFPIQFTPPSEAVFSDSIFHHRKQFSWFHFSLSESILWFNLPLHQKQYSPIPFPTSEVILIA